MKLLRILLPLVLLCAMSAPAAAQQAYFPGGVAKTHCATKTTIPGDTPCPDGTAASPSVVTTSTASQQLSNCKSVALETNRACKVAAGNVYTVTVDIGATSGYLQIEDATVAPADGAVTPIYCIPIVSNGTLGGVQISWVDGKYFTTGLTLVFSTAAGCFTQTAANATFFATYK